MKRGLHAIVAVSLVALVAACGNEAPPAGGPQIDPDPVIPETEEEDSDKPLTLIEALDTFGSCMRLDTWVRTGLYNLHLVETDAGDECNACHGDGATGGLMLNLQVVDTFEAHSQFPSIMRLVTGTVNDRGNFEDLVPANRYIAKGVESCPPVASGLPCHPSYELPPDMEAAVTSFVDETLDRWRTDTCDVPFAEE